MKKRPTHVVLATAALSALALLVAGPAGAYVPEGDGVHGVGAQPHASAAGGAPQADARHQALATRSTHVVATPSASSGGDVDWASFGAGAGMAALLAAGCAGVVATTRKRRRVSLP